ANEYCDNPVQAWLRTSGESMNYGGGGCALGGPTGVGAGVVLLVATALALLVLRRRRRARTTLPALTLTLALGFPGPGTARADAAHRGWRGEARGSLSVQNPAYAFGGAGAFAWRRVEVGGFLELNPWYDVNREMMSLGATNFGVFTHYLHSLRPDLRLRAGVGLGLSVLTLDLPRTTP